MEAEAMTPDIRALIFDKDGLMLDTEGISQRAWHLADEQHGHKLDHGFYLSLIGHGRGDVINLLATELNCSDSAEVLLESHNTHFKAIRSEEGINHKPGLLDILRELKKLELPMAVATSSESPNAQMHLKMTDIHHFFDVVVTGDMVNAGKPSPDIFLMAATLLNIPPAHCLVLEDSEAGIRGAHSAGMTPIQIPDRLQPSELSRTLAFRICHNLEEASTVIRELLSPSSRDNS